jgi:hypothetical protein
MIMETNRFIQIMMMELTSKTLKIEEKLELVINSDLDIEDKTQKCKTLLRKLTLAENEHARFMKLISKDEINNEE